MEELSNPKVEEPFHNKWKSYVSTLCHLMYSYLPMTIYMTCLYIISVSRESLGILSLIMVLMLHPVVCFIFGKFSDCIDILGVWLLKLFTHLKLFQKKN